MFSLTNTVTSWTVALPSSIQRVSGLHTWETRRRELKLTVQNYLHSVSKYTTREARLPRNIFPFKAYCLSTEIALDLSKSRINPLNTKRRLLYLKTQFVPRSKHFSSQL